MASRSFWKGYLKLSLVTCRVAMLPVKSDSEKVKFHTINRRTGNRIRSRFVDAVTGDVVDEDDEVKGYARSETEDIILEDDELASIALESTRTIDIAMFVDETSIAPVWYDTPHYLIPDDKVGAEAFAVIRDAMKASAKVGISRLVLYRRERVVLLKPRDDGIILWTLRYGNEIRETKPYFGPIQPIDVAPELASLISDLIAERTVAWSADLVKDPVQDRLFEIIKAKKKGKKARIPTKEKEVSDNVIDLMEAMKRSLKGRNG